MTRFMLAAGIAAAYLVSASAAAQTVREKCDGSRCVYYSEGKRVFSASRDDTGRVVVRGWPQQRVIAKIKERERGTVRVEKPRR